MELEFLIRGKNGVRGRGEAPSLGGWDRSPSAKRFSQFFNKNEAV